MSSYLYAVALDGQDPIYVTAAKIQDVLNTLITEDDYMDVSIRRVGDAPSPVAAVWGTNRERVSPP